MDQLIPSFALLVDSFRSAFARPETFATFQHRLAGGIVPLGPRTISEVWQATGRAATHHRDTAYSFFAAAKWDGDDLGKFLIPMVVARLLPTGTIRIVVDDTLGHERGTKVAFGGFFLDAVTSTKRKKNVRFGVNWIVVGLSVHLPFRPDRAFTLPVLWRAYRQKGTDGYRTRSTTAADAAARFVATTLPDRECWLIGDGAHLNKTTLIDRPKNLNVLGPPRWNAAPHRPPEPRKPGPRGASRVYGDRLPTPKAMLEDTTAFPATTRRIRFGRTERELRVRVLGDTRWPTGAKREAVTVVLVRDVAGEWRDEVLRATGRGVPAAFVLSGYCRRWGELRRHTGGVAVAAVGRVPFAGVGRRTNSRGNAKPLDPPTHRRPGIPKHESDTGSLTSRRRETEKPGEVGAVLSVGRAAV